MHPKRRQVRGQIARELQAHMANKGLAPKVMSISLRRRSNSPSFHPSETKKEQTTDDSWSNYIPIMLRVDKDDLESN